jgi:PAS domain S-box-containing protein
VDGDLKLLRENLDELFEHAPCGYLLTMPDGVVVRANRTFEQWTGYPRERLLSGMRFQDLLTVPCRIYHDTHFAPLLRMQGAVKEVALDIARPDREALPVLVNAVEKRDERGQPRLTLITIFDATDRRKYERELLLARRRADQAVETERAARELAERAGRVKDEFLATVSHELRTPLNAILGWVQVLAQDPDLTDDLREGLAVIERNTCVQVQLVDDLLDMGRITSGKMRLDVQRLDLASVVEAAIETARPAADAKGLRLDKVLDPTAAISGDPGRLQQVFWNLLSNAVKFTPRDGFIRVVMRKVNSHVEVSVTDSGQGMKPGFLTHAFERFRQADTQGTRKTGGLGLGLSIVKNLVEMHGGSVAASSEGEGKGSTFVVQLPLAALHPDGECDRVHPTAAVAGKPFVLPKISLSGVKVLVVEDDADARGLIRRVLAEAGATVVAAASTAEALAGIEQFVPNVLVSDIGLPEHDGYELIRRVRMLGEAVGRVQAIALTAFARLEDRTQAMLAGYQMHLAKPVDPRELVVTVASLAGRVGETE